MVLTRTVFCGSVPIGVRLTIVFWCKAFRASVVVPTRETSFLTAGLLPFLFGFDLFLLAVLSVMVARSFALLTNFSACDNKLSMSSVSTGDVTLSRLTSITSFSSVIDILVPPYPFTRVSFTSVGSLRGSGVG